MVDIRVENLTKKYGNHVVFDNFNHVFKGHAVHVIKGKSGGGKTTLLRLLMSLEVPDAGRITLDQSIRKAAVFQEDRLCENLSILKNIQLVNDQLTATQIQQELSKVSLTDMYQKVSTLSGGMKRRVAIIRALLAKADILFFDEPLKGLDEKTKQEVLEYIKDKIQDKTVFWVTHDADEYTIFESYDLLEL
ncbi:MAG: ATP-binding cassette domain-containing protein [Erysipelotrichaceae bacterium]|nr:ATP-binding cassette domain-containing protein [Erysipelotrichaceae bacterium]MDY6035694.1 ATP-binding cassette domain-containing protein [Bulleidia sp.]